MQPWLAQIVQEVSAETRPNPPQESVVIRLQKALQDAGRQHDATEGDMRQALAELGVTTNEAQDAALEEMASWL